MGLVIQAGQLVSRSTRKKIAGNSGLRKLDLKGAITEQKSESGIISFIFNAGKKLVGFASAVVRFFSWSITGVWEWLVERTIELSQFDWNTSDKELKQQLQASNEQLTRLYGGLAGSSLGWLAAMGLGFGVSLLVPVIGGTALAASISLAVGKEALEDLGGRLKATLFASINVAAYNATINSYIGFRRMLKDPNNPVLGWIFGSDRANKLKREWGREGGPSWTIGGAIEKKIESIPNKFLKAFVEGAVEEGVESFIEAGYIVAYELENAFESARLANQNQLGPEKIVRLEADKRIDEPILLKGAQSLLEPAIQTTLAQARLIQNRDVGQIVGETVEEAVSALPQTRQLLIVFKGKAKPRWMDAKGQKVKEVKYAVPDVDRNLTWERIKHAAKHFIWGEVRAVATLDNRRQMVVYGASRSEAKEKLKSLLELSTAKALTIRISDDDLVPIDRKKKATTVYPAYATLIVKKQNQSKLGTSTIEGKKYDTQRIRIDLWPDTEPPNLPHLG
jgi:hypothetical protein